MLAAGANAVPDAHGFLCTRDSAFSGRATLYSRTDCISSEHMIAQDYKVVLRKNQKLRQAESDWPLPRMSEYGQCNKYENRTSESWFRKPERRVGR
jgi:hypothetical protein